MTEIDLQPQQEIGRRFGRLRIKLFLAIAGANAVLAIAAYLIFSWSFDQGVADYLKRADLDRLDNLSVALAEGYAREGNWNWIVKNEARWDEMSRNALGLPPRKAQGDAGPWAEGPSRDFPLTEPRWDEMSRNALGLPPRRPRDDGGPGAELSREFPLTINRRLMLFGADRKILIGRPDRAQQAELKAVTVGTQTVGYIGYVPRLEAVESIGRLYSEQQNMRFGVLALGMLVASLLLGAGLAYWLSVRIRALARGTTSLIQGDYDIHLEANGRDEIAQLARDFNKLAATLTANRAARNQWIADIAHELRTPLAVLRGEIEALQDGVRPLNAASLASLAQEVERLGRLVEDLHLLSTSDLGALSHHFEVQNLGELIEETLEHQRAALQGKAFELRLQLDSGALVQGDGMRLVQVFSNLLQNTLRYTDAPGRLQIDLRREGDRWVIDWQDSSPGVPEEDLPRLTDRLFRVENSRNRESGGSGLGLAIAKAIVGAHHGSMIARNSPLGGLWWRLEFPLDGPAHG